MDKEKTGMDDLSYEQFMAIKAKMDEAENDTTPYAIVDENDNNAIKVIGDVNNTAKKSEDFVIQFGYRNTPENREKYKGEKIIGETDNYLGVERTYKDAWIPARRYTSVQAVLVQLYKFFNIITEDGDTRDLTPDETIEALHAMNDEMVDAMCHVVATVLGIPETEEEFMLPTSTIRATLEIVDAFPEVINGVDFSTDKSPEMQ